VRRVSRPDVVGDVDDAALEYAFRAVWLRTRVPASDSPRAYLRDICLVIERLNAIGAPIEQRIAGLIDAYERFAGLGDAARRDIEYRARLYAATGGKPWFGMPAVDPDSCPPPSKGTS
jgi:hypothetical protein